MVGRLTVGLVALMLASTGYARAQSGPAPINVNVTSAPLLIRVIRFGANRALQVGSPFSQVFPPTNYVCWMTPPATKPASMANVSYPLVFVQGTVTYAAFQNQPPPAAFITTATVTNQSPGGIASPASIAPSAPGSSTSSGQ
jgi:hypothetical protein